MGVRAAKFRRVSKNPQSTAAATIEIPLSRAIGQSAYELPKHHISREYF